MENLFIHRRNESNDSLSIDPSPATSTCRRKGQFPSCSKVTEIIRGWVRTTRVAPLSSSLVNYARRAALHTTTYDAPSYYTESPKYYSSPSYATKAHVYYTEAPECYATTYAAPSYYTEAPKYYSAPSYCPEAPA
ncbi:hypothetical protein DAPPUDRAFT_316614 [Daphnia pulex]|uniref:Uncharacterized protein n=1 Tax=Daphnia pulex TaxID=6669 RepID=E9GDG6_DAPPU|nr:hypothetical protein DAPPUDRAFT_316614 [Daphnia pulex]|eukprot:EFX82482.1 hypothetical protein DAPPUDRAFT_316614 [Daphnia pulex]